MQHPQSVLCTENVVPVISISRLVSETKQVQNVEDSSLPNGIHYIHHSSKSRATRGKALKTPPRVQQVFPQKEKDFKHLQADQSPQRLKTWSNDSGSAQ
jgi:hypothetical protein